MAGVACVVGTCTVSRHVWQGACMAGGCGRGACLVGDICGGGGVWQGEHAWGHVWGACMGACMAGACVAGVHMWWWGHAWQATHVPPADTTGYGMQRAVHIPLECILVSNLFADICFVMKYRIKCLYHLIVDQEYSQLSLRPSHCLQNSSACNTVRC